MHRRLMVMMVRGMVLAGGLSLAFDSPAWAGDEMIDRAAPQPALGDSWKATGPSVGQESTMHISLALRGPIQVRDCAREELLDGTELTRVVGRPTTGDERWAVYPGSRRPCLDVCHLAIVGNRTMVRVGDAPADAGEAGERALVPEWGTTQSLGGGT